MYFTTINKLREAGGQNRPKEKKKKGKKKPRPKEIRLMGIKASHKRVHCSIFHESPIQELPNTPPREWVNTQGHHLEDHAAKKPATSPCNVRQGLSSSNVEGLESVHFCLCRVQKQVKLTSTSSEVRRRFPREEGCERAPGALGTAAILPLQHLHFTIICQDVRL